MTYTLAKLLVSAEIYEAIRRRLEESGDEGLRRVDSPTPGHLNLDGVALAVDPSRDSLLRLTWPCCGFPRTGGHNGSCTFYGLDEPNEDNKGG